MDTDVRSQYRLFRRSNGIYFYEDRQTRKQGSLKTRDLAEAKRLLQAHNEAIQLARNARDELKRFVDQDSTRNSLNVPNGTRRVFTVGAATLEGLRQLHNELSDLILRVDSEQPISKIFNFGSVASSGKTPLWEERRPDIVLRNSY